MGLRDAALTRPVLTRTMTVATVAVVAGAWVHSVVVVANQPDVHPPGLEWGVLAPIAVAVVCAGVALARGVSGAATALQCVALVSVAALLVLPRLSPMSPGHGAIPLLSVLAAGCMSP